VSAVPAPVLYFDLASPYAYLAVERAASVLGEEPELRPVLVGAIFGYRGWGSWAGTPERDRNTAEVERRARAYGLPLVWPPGWPANSLMAQRAATFAAERGVVAPFAHAAYGLHFGQGLDLRDPEVVLAAGEAAGLARDDLAAAVEDRGVKDALRRATEDAYAEGVMGVPSIRVGAHVLWGDDRLETARQALAAAASSTG
jgi:2-hydroxychromene-2-carboxylate isomerase